MSLQDGISIPVVAGTTPSYNVRSGQAYEPYGYESADPTSAHVTGIAASNGNQTWTQVTTFSGGTEEPVISSDGYIYSDCSLIVTNNDTDVLAGVGVSGIVLADTTYNTVWNDLADCIEVQPELKLEYGRCYCFDGEKYNVSSKYLDDGIIGIHSDTAGFFIGDKGIDNQLKTAVAGFVLAYVDKVYPVGTPLTCSENGCLTELKEEDIESNPHKLVATFWKDEDKVYWGYDDASTYNLLIEVNGRKWVKVR